MRFGSLSGPGKKRTFQPRFETLEDRYCPSVSVITAPLHVGNELRITGDAGPDTIKIVDNGAGHIDVLGANGHSLGSANNVTSLKLNSGGGPDNISYQLSHPLTVNEAMLFTLGDGATNALKLDFSAGIQGANLLVGVMGGAGADTIKVTLGSISTAYVNLFVSGGAGNDSITVADGAADIPRGSSVRVDLSGGAGNDNLSAAFSGSIFGSLMVNAYGGAGNDAVNVNVMVEEGSTGKVQALVDGGKGHDDLTLYMDDYSGDSHDVSALSLLRATIRQPRGAHNSVASTPNVTIVTM